MAPMTAIAARPAEGPLVAEDPAVGSERLESKAREIPALRSLDVRSRHAICLRVDVDRWVGILAQRPVRSPRGQSAGRPAIAVIGAIAAFLGRKIEAHDVGRMAGDQPLALSRPDDVVRRSDDRRKIPHARRVEAQGTEGAKDGHGSLRVSAHGPSDLGHTHRTIGPSLATTRGRLARVATRRNFHGGSGVLAPIIPL